MEEVWSNDNGTRNYFMKRVTYEVQTFAAHIHEVKWFKCQFGKLKTELQFNAIIIRWDYIENYVHDKNYSISSQHFGKKQSTLLVATVWFWDSVYNQKKDTMERCVIKKWFDFTSEYLNHNSFFYEKCFAILLEDLQAVVPYQFDILYNVTDNGNHFISRYAFWFLGKMAYTYSK